MSTVTKLPAPTQIFVDTLGRLTVDARKFLSELYNKVGGGSPTTAFNIPVGGVFMWAGLLAPSGFLLCNGNAISRSMYPELFAAIGTDYGAGDGSTTFNLPDLRSKVPLGASTTYSRGVVYGSTAATLAQANLPNINFTVTETPHTHTINVTDAGHTHIFTGTAHSHTTTDAGHTHTTAAHSHTVSGGNFVTDAAGTEYLNTAGNKGTTQTSTADATVTVNSAISGVTINNATAGGTNASNTTGITAVATSVSTGITVASGGSAVPVSLLQPSLAINYIIRAL